MDEQFDLQKAYERFFECRDFDDILIPHPNEFSLDKFPTTEAGVIEAYEHLNDLTTSLAEDYRQVRNSTASKPFSEEGRRKWGELWRRKVDLGTEFKGLRIRWAEQLGISKTMGDVTPVIFDKFSLSEQTQSRFERIATEFYKTNDERIVKAYLTVSGHSKPATNGRN